MFKRVKNWLKAVLWNWLEIDRLDREFMRIDYWTKSWDNNLQAHGFKGMDHGRGVGQIVLLSSDRSRIAVFDLDVDDRFFEIERDIYKFARNYKYRGLDNSGLYSLEHKK